MPHSRRLILFLFGCVTLLPAVATAQSPFTPGGWILTPSVGIVFDPDADASLTASAAAGYPLSAPRVGVEGELGHVFDLVPDDRDVDSSLTTIHGAVLYFFETSYAATPYLAAGLGVGHFSHNVTGPAPGSQDSTEIGFNLGGGLTYPVDDRLWLRGDFRVFKHIDEIPTAWRLGASVVFSLPN
jgi:hypothetical protein